jgi:hypothetical protein
MDLDQGVQHMIPERDLQAEVQADVPVEMQGNKEVLKQVKVK